MKRTIAFLLIMLILGCSGIWAVDTVNATLGGSVVGSGICLIMIGASDVFDFDSETKIILYCAGGLMAGLGLVLFIMSLVADDPNYAMAEDNSILKIVSFSACEDKVYLGAHFRF